MLERIDRSVLTVSEMRSILQEPPENIRGLFSYGNTKLGKDILSFSLPAAVTCPGRTALCEDLCYALRGHYCWPATQKGLAKNLVITCRDDFKDIVLRQLTSSRRQIVRLHASGDLYDEEYAAKWLAVARATSGKSFYLYTRSWRLPAIREVLTELSRQRNVRLWFSVDQETGWPGAIPARVRIAYMQTAPDDRPKGRVDLVFRDYSVRRKPAKYIEDGALICPAENGASHLTCDSCKLCFGPLNGVLDPRNHKKGKT